MIMVLLRDERRSRHGLLAVGVVLLAAGCGSAESKQRGGSTVGSMVATSQRSADPSCGHQGDAEPPRLAGITAAHNAIRCGVSRPSGEPLPPLSWSRALAAEAQRYAEVLAKSGCKLEHSRTEHGENLFGGSGKNSPDAVVERWAGEQRCFDYQTFPDCCSCTCGHYTQLVWGETRHLGCGMATCADGAEVWVCNYDPAGNYVGSPPF
jgi:hypothetical protein